MPVWEEGYTFNFKLIEKDKAPPGKIFTPPSALAIAMIPPSLTPCIISANRLNFFGAVRG